MKSRCLIGLAARLDLLRGVVLRLAQEPERRVNPVARIVLAASDKVLSHHAGRAPSDVGTYPNGATKSGSAYSRESGAQDNLIR